MAARPQTPLHDAYGSVPSPTDPTHLSRGYDSTSRPDSYLASGTTGHSDFAQTQGAPMETSPLPQSAHHNEGLDINKRGSSLIDTGATGDLHRADSQMSQSQTLLPSRGGTLKKKASLSRRGSLRRSNSKRSSYAGSVRSLDLGQKEKYSAGEGDEMNSAFFSPIPTTSNPTEILANRFQGTSLSCYLNMMLDSVSF